MYVSLATTGVGDETTTGYRNTIKGDLDDHEARLALAESPILGEALLTATQSGITTETTLATVTVTLAASRRLCVSGYGLIASTAAGDRYVLSLVDAGTGTTLTQWVETAMVQAVSSGTGRPETPTLTVPAGTHTYHMTLQRASGSTGTLSVIAQATSPAWLKVRDEGPA